MDEFFRDVLFETIGASVRFVFFSTFGRKKKFLEYYNDDYSTVNLLVGVLITVAIVVLVIVLYTGMS